MNKDAVPSNDSPSRLIDARIKELNDWRGAALAHVRGLINQAIPELNKRGQARIVSKPCWQSGKMLCRFDHIQASDFNRQASIERKA